MLNKPYWSPGGKLTITAAQEKDRRGKKKVSHSAARMLNLWHTCSSPYVQWTTSRAGNMLRGNDMQPHNSTAMVTASNVWRKEGRYQEPKPPIYFSHFFHLAVQGKRLLKKKPLGKPEYFWISLSILFSNISETHISTALICKRQLHVGTIK